MRSVSLPFYTSSAWKACRKAYLHSVNGLCEECQKRGILRPAYIVHHKIELDDDKAKDPEIALNFDNLEAVCLDCHNRLHYGAEVKRRYEIVDGAVVIADEE